MDAAFKTAPYPAYTIAQLRDFVSLDHTFNRPANKTMIAEIERRAKVAAGDWSVMMPGERLRALRAEESKP